MNSNSYAEVGPQQAETEQSLPEVLECLRRAERRAETLSNRIDALSGRLGAVLRADPPTAGESLKQVGFSTPLASQIDTLADRLSSSIKLLDSVLSRLEI